MVPSMPQQVTVTPTGPPAARRRAVRTPDMIETGVAATTREFVDVVLGLLPAARRDTEFAAEVAL